MSVHELVKAEALVVEITAGLQALHDSLTEGVRTVQHELSRRINGHRTRKVKVLALHLLDKYRLAGYELKLGPCAALRSLGERKLGLLGRGLPVGMPSILRLLSVGRSLARTPDGGCTDLNTKPSSLITGDGVQR